MFVRSIVLAGLSVLTLGVGATTRGATPTGGTPPGDTADPHGHVSQLRAQSTYDPMAPVYILTSPTTFKGGVNRLASQSEPARDAAGRPLVLSRILSHQLDDVSLQVHERERRCGGYFAFASRAQALAFARSDRTAQAMQAQAITYTIDNAATVNPWLVQVQEARIRDTITRLSTNYPNRYYASTSGQQSAQWIKSTWSNLAHNRADVSVEYVNCATCDTQPSIVMTVRGTTKPNEIVVVGAHEDSISDSISNGVMQAPGADDDASGIATMTEVIRIALAQGWRPQRTVKFMAYAAEEVGLRGSQSIANQHRNANANVVGVLQLDMTNYNAGTTHSMRLVQDFSNAALQKFVTDLFDRYLAPLGLTRGVTACGYACSDHASWTSAGYPSAFMEEPTMFPYLHTPNDKFPNIGPNAAVSVNFAKLALAFVAELGKTGPSLDRDFNGDGFNDVFWRNFITGGNEIWRSADGNTRTAVTAASSNWQARFGDFNGDAKTDVLWRNLKTGDHDVWLAANNASRMTIQNEPDLGWRVAGVGDFNGDLRQDIFWRHSTTGATKYWPSANASQAVAQATVADQNWQVVGVGDFDNDDRDDVFWHNGATGANEIWRSGNASTRRAVTTTSLPWRVAGVGDFNKDGKDDILLRHSSTGGNVIWRSADSATPQGVTAMPDLRWSAAQVADFDGDGYADILWRHQASGANEYWKAATSTRRVVMASVTDLNWKILP